MTTQATPDSPIPDDEVDAAQVMVLRVGATTCALPTAQLREVTRARPATRVPGTPAWVRGIVAVRGALVPVAELGEESGWLALVEHEGRAAAFGVTAFDGARRVAAELPAASRTSDALPRRGAVRLASDGVAEPGDAREVDLLDVGALFDQLFDGE